MSPSIAIPKASIRKSNKQSTPHTASSSLSSSSTSPSMPSYNNTTSSTVPAHTMAAPPSRSSARTSTSSASESSSYSPSTPPARILTAKDKGKGKMVVTPEQIAEEERLRWAASPFRRRPSLMGKELEATKHIVVDVGAPDAPRLISCVASSQGFDWNSSIFLPRYLTGRYADEQLEHRQDPIEDIFVSDEEARNIFPQW